MNKEQFEKSVAKGHALYCKMMDAGAFDNRSQGGSITSKPKMKKHGTSGFGNRRITPARYKQVLKSSPFKPMSSQDWVPQR